MIVKRNKNRFKVVKLNKPLLYIVVFTLVLVFITKIIHTMVFSLVKKVPTSFYKKSVSLSLNDDYKKSTFNPKLFPSDILSYASIGFFKEDIKELNSQSVIAKEDTENEEKNEEILVNAKSVTTKELSLSNETTYKIDIESFISKSINYNAVSSEPKILIMHTHGSESYIDQSSTYRSEDKNKNMVYIGNVIENELKKRGISVIHDTTLCDMPSYNNSYVKAQELIGSYIKKYPSIEFVFDIHRDAISDKDGVPTKLICENDPNCAQAMIVCGTDLLGLNHPYWQDNLTLGLKIQKKATEKYPGLLRNLNLRKERFNMHMTKGSLIFEIGTYANSLNEAKNCAIKLSDAVSEVVLNK